MPYEYRIERLRVISISPSMANYESEVVDIRQTVSDLNKWARDGGWELVSVVPAGAEWLAFLKRPAGE